MYLRIGYASVVRAICIPVSNRRPPRPGTGLPAKRAREFFPLRGDSGPEVAIHVVFFRGSGEIRIANSQRFLLLSRPQNLGYTVVIQPGDGDVELCRFQKTPRAGQGCLLCFFRPTQEFACFHASR